MRAAWQPYSGSTTQFTLSADNGTAELKQLDLVRTEASSSFTCNNLTSLPPSRLEGPPPLWTSCLAGGIVWADVVATKA